MVCWMPSIIKMPRLCKWFFIGSTLQPDLVLYGVILSDTFESSKRDLLSASAQWEKEGDEDDVFDLEDMASFKNPAIFDRDGGIGESDEDDDGKDDGDGSKKKGSGDKRGKGEKANPNPNPKKKPKKAKEPEEETGELCPKKTSADLARKILNIEGMELKLAACSYGSAESSAYWQCSLGTCVV